VSIHMASRAYRLTACMMHTIENSIVVVCVLSTLFVDGIHAQTNFVMFGQPCV